MACFIAPAVEAVAVSIIQHNIKKKEQNETKLLKAEKENTEEKISKKLPMSQKLSWLNKLLWGGSFLLLIEHIWHGEVVFYFPFFTAMENMNDTISMLIEIATVGLAMALACTLIWCCMLLGNKIIENISQKRRKSAEEID